MIIGFAGRQRAGKDTAANYLASKYGYTRVGFADKLKDSVAALFDITREDIEKYKLDPLARVEIVEYADESLNPSFAFIKSYTFREFLKRYGTESHRDVFGENFWVNEVMREYGRHTGGITISDVRFKNEQKIINHSGGVVVYIYRPEAEKRAEGEIHSSETEITKDDCDYVIVNDEPLELFYMKLNDMLATITMK